MKWIWMIVTILLAVAGTIGLYNEIERLISGGEFNIVTALRIGLAILLLVIAVRTYAKAKPS